MALVAISCFKQNKNTDGTPEQDKPNNTVTLGITILHNKTEELIPEISSNIDSSLCQQTKVKKNIGSFVNHSIIEIAPKNAKITTPETTFNPGYNFLSKSKNAHPVIFTLTFDNDIFDNTDYYYTNGVYFELITPLASQSLFSRMLIGIRNSEIILHSFTLRQNIYTPINPDIAEISFGDRPFSAFLTIGQSKRSYSIDNKVFIKSSINIGVLGPASLGGVVQSSIHSIEPIGWENQITNSVVIDYLFHFEKSILSTPHTEANIIAGANVGTIFNKINTGLYFRIGNFTPLYRGQFLMSGNQQNNRRLQFWFFISAKANIVFYDATLQGSIFGNNSPYVLSTSTINRYVAGLSAGFSIYYKKVGVELSNNYISPEFDNAYDFRWGSIKLSYQF